MENTLEITQTTDAEAVTAEVWAPLAFGEGARVGVLGDSRCGKTHAMRELIAGYRRRVPGVVVIVDDKNPEPQFAGQYFKNKAELEARRPDPAGPPIFVLRGERFDRVAGEVDPEEAAEIQWGLLQEKVPCLAVYDELDKACNNGQFKRGDAKSTILWGFRRGGASGGSELWGAQETQAVPAGPFNQSDHILAFRMVGAPLRLLGDRGYLEPRGSVEKFIPTLPGPETPPAQRGRFVLLRRGRPWDGKFYRYKTPR